MPATALCVQNKLEVNIIIKILNDSFMPKSPYAIPQHYMEIGGVILYTRSERIICTFYAPGPTFGSTGDDTIQYSETAHPYNR